jgi:hypothetical protein
MLAGGEGAKNEIFGEAKAKMTQQQTTTKNKNCD